MAALVGADAARVRRRRSKEHGWVAVQLGVVARTRAAGGERWLEGEHATHWAWPDFDEAERFMLRLRRQGTTAAVLTVWAPVWELAGRESVAIGPPMDPGLVLPTLCWAVLRSDVPNTWAHRTITDELTWRNEQPSDTDVQLL